MELITKVQTYRVDKQCDICGEGVMYFTGNAGTTFHTVFDHKCSECGATEGIINTKYPKQVTKDIGKAKKRKV